MCGIFGHIPKKGKAVNLDKVKILGMVNQSRGKDSCGYYYNGHLYKGVDKEKEFIELLERRIITAGDKRPMFIGHTRYATGGSHTEANAHPYHIDGMIFSHNGVIYNADEMALKYGIDTKALNLNVDSQILGHLIKKEGWKILNEYIGFAALAFTIDNKVYLYHGASKNLKVNPAPIEERPLYFMDTPTGLFYSSLQSSLLMIRDSEKEVPKVLAHNTLWRFDDVSKGWVNDFTVEREENNIEVDYYKYPVTYPKGSSHPFMGAGTTTKDTKTNSRIAASTGLLISSLVWKETVPIRAKSEEIVYFHKGRYWYKIGTETSLCHGTMKLNKKGKPVEVEEVGETFNFFRGVMINNFKLKEFHQFLTTAEGRLLNEEVTTAIFANFAFFVSNFSTYPVTNMSNEGTGIGADRRFSWYFRRKNPSVNLSVKFSSRTYVIVGGELKSVSCSDKNDIDPIYGESRTTMKSEEVSDMLGNSAETYHAERQAIRKIFKKVYSSLDDFYKDTKETPDVIEVIYDALNIYMKDYNMDGHDLDELTEMFMDSCIKDGLSLLDSFPQSYDFENELEGYFVFKAESEELNNDADEVEETDNKIMINKIVETAIKNAKAKAQTEEDENGKVHYKIGEQIEFEELSGDEGLNDEKKIERTEDILAQMREQLRKSGTLVESMGKVKGSEDLESLEKNGDPAATNKTVWSSEDFAISEEEDSISKKLRKQEENEETQEVLDIKTHDLNNLFDVLHRTATTFQEGEHNVEQGIAYELFNEADVMKDKLQTIAKRFDFKLKIKQ